MNLSNTEYLKFEVFAENKTLKKLEFPLIQNIGKGGFGEVYLTVINNEKLLALKEVKGSFSEKEIKSLRLLKEKVESNESSALLKIMDLYSTSDTLVYTMPLANNLNIDKHKHIYKHDDYVPATLANFAEFFKDFGKYMWFTVPQIKEYSLRLFDAVLELNSYGILHRDIKPSNVVFVDNKPYLGDFGIISEDSETPEDIVNSSYFAPYSYIESGGNPDMWGLASTLFFMCTGNDISYVDRAWAKFPNDTQINNDKEFIEEYTHWRRCILKAISEDKSYRYTSIEAFKNDWEKNEKYTFGDKGYKFIDDKQVLINLEKLKEDDFYSLQELILKKQGKELSDIHEMTDIGGRALKALKAKDYKKVEELTKNLQESPRYATLYYLRATALFQLEQYEDALKSVTKAIDYDTDLKEESYNLKAQLLLKLGQIELSKIAMEKSKSFQRPKGIKKQSFWTKFLGYFKK